MKYSKYLYLLLTALFMSACSDDEKISGGKDGEDDERPETIAWIEDTMRDEYLWNGDIPNAKNLNYNSEPKPFFTSLLSAKDGKTKNDIHQYYSYIEKVSESTRGFIQEEYTYGFEYTIVKFSDRDNTYTYYGVLVLYVIPDSPAAKAGIKRGDWIIKANNKEILTDASLENLFDGSAKTLTIAQWNHQEWEFVNHNQISINNARSIDYNPIFMAEIIPWGNKKVGYLVYDRFTKGKDNKDSTFDDELRSLSNQLFNGVDEFVLDLRYNNGGLLSCVQLLCAILGPSTEENIGYLQYNDETKSPFGAGSRILGSGKNLNLKRLFVLVSSQSASASEAVINLLKPLMKVEVIGEKTEGKNVGSETFTSKDKVWEMHPITSTIFNSKGDSDYVQGIPPNREMADTFDYDSKGNIKYIHNDIYDLGDERERLLRVALDIIGGASINNSVSRGSLPTGTTFKRGPFNSIDRKATNGVIIDIER